MNEFGEPSALTSVDDWRALIALATKNTVEGRVQESARLMTRLFTEAALKDCERLLLAGGEEWLEAAKPGAQASALLAEAGAAISRDDFRGAHEAFKKLLPMIKPETPGALRMMLFGIGVSGAAATQNR